MRMTTPGIPLPSILPSIDASVPDFLKLDVRECRDHNGHDLYSLDNRRLYCLKQHQENTRHLGWVVHVRSKIITLDRKVIQRFELRDRWTRIDIRR